MIPLKVKKIFIKEINNGNEVTILTTESDRSFNAPEYFEPISYKDSTLESLENTLEKEKRIERGDPIVLINKPTDQALPIFSQLEQQPSRIEKYSALYKNVATQKYWVNKYPHIAVRYTEITAINETVDR